MFWEVFFVRISVADLKFLVIFHGICVQGFQIRKPHSIQ
jgi:hypothetical protein